MAAPFTPTLGSCAKKYKITPKSPVGLLLRTNPVHGKRSNMSFNFERVFSIANEFCGGLSNVSFQPKAKRDVTAGKKQERPVHMIVMRIRHLRGKGNHTVMGGAAGCLSMKALRPSLSSHKKEGAHGMGSLSSVSVYPSAHRALQNSRKALSRSGSPPKPLLEALLGIRLHEATPRVAIPGPFPRIVISSGSEKSFKAYRLILLIRKISHFVALRSH